MGVFDNYRTVGMKIVLFLPKILLGYMFLFFIPLFISVSFYWFMDNFCIPLTNIELHVVYSSLANSLVYNFGNSIITDTFGNSIALKDLEIAAIVNIIKVYFAFTLFLGVSFLEILNVIVYLLVIEVEEMQKKVKTIVEEKKASQENKVS